MKQIVTILMLFSSIFTLWSQEYIDSEGLATDQIVETADSVEIIRRIAGGTIFDVTYDDNCSYEMQGAFNYACKLLEETLPPSLPITVKVEWANLRGGSTATNQLSKIRFATLDDFGREELCENQSHPLTRIKGVVLMEYNMGTNYTYLGSIYDTADTLFFNNPEKPDIHITYNLKYANDFSFALDNPSVDKYDFVSVALRDLVRGLAISCGYTLGRDGKSIKKPGNKETPFEAVIHQAFGTDSPEEQYVKATQGELALPVEPALKLYAPENWQNSVSLNYFMPDENYAYSKVLSYNFGRGTVCRNLTGYWDFETLLGWVARGVTVGSGSADLSAAGTTSVKVPYNGSFKTSNAPYRIIAAQPTNSSAKSHMKISPNAPNFLEEFHVFKGNNGFKEGTSICLLKIDGTWDLVYFIPTILNPGVLELNMTEWTLNCQNEEYARTCDGYLRGRITYSERNQYRSGYDYKTTYFVVDYLPQKVELSEVQQSSETYETRAVTADNQRPIRVVLKNLEGLTRVVIERKRQGHRVPSKFDVPDFRKGYFETTVETDKQTTFTAIAYNENGSTRSLPLVIQPLTETTASELTFAFDGGTISISGLKDNDRISYEIAPLTAIGYAFTKQGQTLNGSVDVSDLPIGLYAIKCIDKSGNISSFKFKIAH